MPSLQYFNQPDDQLTCLWEQERFVWIPEGTQKCAWSQNCWQHFSEHMKSKSLLRNVLDVLQSHLNITSYRRGKANGEEHTDYQLRVGKYIVYLTRICYSS